MLRDGGFWRHGPGDEALFAGRGCLSLRKNRVLLSSGQSPSIISKIRMYVHVRQNAIGFILGEWGRIPSPGPMLFLIGGSHIRYE